MVATPLTVLLIRSWSSVRCAWVLPRQIRPGGQPSWTGGSRGSPGPTPPRVRPHAPPPPTNHPSINTPTTAAPDGSSAEAHLQTPHFLMPCIKGSNPQPWVPCAAPINGIVSSSVLLNCPVPCLHKPGLRATFSYLTNTLAVSSDRKR